MRMSAHIKDRDTLLMNITATVAGAISMLATKKKAAELGAAGLLTKPIDFGLLR
jgi:hypothetical protein